MNNPKGRSTKAKPIPREKIRELIDLPGWEGAAFCCLFYTGFRGGELFRSKVDCIIDGKKVIKGATWKGIYWSDVAKSVLWDYRYKGKILRGKNNGRQEPKITAGMRRRHKAAVKTKIPVDVAFHDEITLKMPKVSGHVARYRRVVLHPVLRDRLYQYWHEELDRALRRCDERGIRFSLAWNPEGPMFPTLAGGDRWQNKSLSYVNKLIKKRGKEMGLESSQMKSHAFRKSIGQILYDETGDIALVREFYNHRSIASTSHYIGVDAARVAKAVKNIEI
jgi:hypothetical protein